MSLELRGVTVRYGAERVVLDKLDLDVAQGESLAVMGPSGSGKTTLISVLGLLTRPEAGSITIDSRAAPKPERLRHEIRRQTFGWVFQTVNVLGRRSALDNVMLPLMALGYPRSDAATAAASALKEVGLARLSAQPTRLLSGGEVQRVCIARALAHRPRYLLADEPTGQLDRRASVEVLDALNGFLKSTGAGLVIVTHDPQVADSCDRVVDLVDGKAVDR